MDQAFGKYVTVSLEKKNKNHMNLVYTPIFINAKQFFFTEGTDLINIITLFKIEIFHTGCFAHR